MAVHADSAVGSFCERSEDDGAAPDSGGTLARVSEREERRDAIERAYAAARRAIALARTYRRDPGSTGRREQECLAQVALLRRTILGLRVAEDRLFPGLGIPGLYKALRSELSSEHNSPLASGRRTG
jgi:hypothetical protein